MIKMVWDRLRSIITTLIIKIIQIVIILLIIVISIIFKKILIMNKIINCKLSKRTIMKHKFKMATIQIYKNK
jgi:hypothetical protein